MRIRCIVLLCCVLAPAATADVPQAQDRVEAGDLTGARSLLEAHLRTEPEDPAARFLLARILAWQGDPAAAIPMLEQLLEASPQNADYLLALGQAQLWAGRVHAATETLERAAELAPDYSAVNDALRQARTALSAPAQRITLPQRTTTRRHELELSVRQDWLDNGFDNWRRQRLDYFSSQAEGVAWYGALLREQRFGESDEGVEAGAVWALDEHWSVQPEVGYQFSSFFLPEWYADLRLQRSLTRGFLGAASVRRTEYANSRVDRLGLTAERYWDSWRAGYTMNISDVSNAGTPIGHTVSLDYYYSGLSYAGLRLTAGEEEAVEGAQLFTSSVRAVGVQGRHWLSRGWAASWEIGVHEQGDIYTRRWLQVGLRHVF
ncbi:YaiO family outer membrane beta-barrel protein [Halopseudomonas nanhaiensis]|uniref:YaiO family outer membrane beta-barrel protein n=1 Tax=Halopseudomonas nanhaiensis TaxID=2830842 RepID=UPI001CBC8DF8|nr:YaiO family outer membrane beta-barrel protein [Halopseudomonas nanhaiensis]UAW99904.1 YaiO family outer membrane beta-barrel protein [Halopseudomonas nanhaiensis]